MNGKRAHEKESTVSECLTSFEDFVFASLNTYFRVLDKKALTVKCLIACQWVDRSKSPLFLVAMQVLAEWRYAHSLK